MKKNIISKGNILLFLLQFVSLLNFINNLTIYIFDKEIHNLVMFIIYGVGFIVATICLFIDFTSDKKYAIAFNDIYYCYGENIIETSKLFETKQIKKRKLKKLSANGLIEYRLIDNEYAYQKIGLIRLDEIKTLIIFYKPKYKVDYKGGLLDVFIDDYNKNKETFIEIVSPPKLEEKYIYYTKKNIEAVVIEELDNYFQCVTYHYEVSNALPDLKSALAFCIPYWGIEYNYPVERFDNFEEAKKYALERVQVLNWEKDETSE